MKEFKKNFQGIEGKKYGLINTHWMKKNRFVKMEKLLSKKKLNVAAVDFQIGKEVQTGNGLTEGWEAKHNEFLGKL